MSRCQRHKPPDWRNQSPHMGRDGF